MNSNWSNLLDQTNLQKQVRKAFFCQKLFWPFTVRTNCTSDQILRCQSSPSNFNFFFSNTRTIFLTVGQNNFGNKMPFFFLISSCWYIRVIVILNMELPSQSYQSWGNSLLIPFEWSCGMTAGTKMLIKHGPIFSGE